IFLDLRIAAAGVGEQVEKRPGRRTRTHGRGGGQIAAGADRRRCGQRSTHRGTSALMAGLGYDARATTDESGPAIEAQNCVFHKLAVKRPEVCRFDLAMMGASTGTTVEHRKCMARGADRCAFSFRQK